MALEYEFSLELIPRPRWEDAMREFLSAMGRAEAMSGVTPGDGGGCVYWNDPYCLLNCGPEPEGSLHQQIRREEFGISINFEFGFRFRESIPWIPEILRGVNHFLGKSSRDAVFLFNGEYIYLMRREGQLYLNNTDPGLWVPERLQFITQPYEMIKIPVL
jgi:hypothetical protein